VSGRVIGAWDDLRVDLRSVLHPDLHPRVLRTSRSIVLIRIAGVALIDFEVAVNHRHASSDAFLFALASLATAGGLIWALGRPQRLSVQAGAIALMATAGGLLGALQHGSPAIAYPAIAATALAADGGVLELVSMAALSLIALELGVIWAGLRASAALGYPAIVLGALLLGVSRRQYVAQTRTAQALLAQTRETEAASRRAAALDERTRIAREIHDVLAHALGGLTVQLDAAELLLTERGDIDGALARIRSSQRTAREGLEEARRAVAALRSDAPPLLDALTGLLESHREHGECGELLIDGSARELAPEVALTLMRSAQEALTNARRHAPGSAVRVCLGYGAESTTVTVTNTAPTRAVAEVDGAVTGGYGLTGMRERLQLAGGRLDAGPDADGWTVRAEVPS
jgi:signal transduction histidine kinase